jgi:hypothetical protein
MELPLVDDFTWERGAGMADSNSAAVVLHFRDRNTLRCALVEDFSPEADRIAAQTDDGRQFEVAIDDLKAVFFLKDPRRRGAAMEFGEDGVRMPGVAVARVEFFDGEIISGRVQHYSIKEKGFFLYPTAVESNNERIFVVAASLVAVDIES